MDRGLGNTMEIEMTLSALFGDATSEAAKASHPVPVAFAAAARAVAAWRAERARRIALNDLLAMAPHRLRDLGISADDIRQALVR